ncbi:MAG: hypothetical protein MJK18_05640, partial [Bdellovibrionales bacterium]|nr:hypothetical protein [Bdellovibrionales bacterium]
MFNKANLTEDQYFRVLQEHNLFPGQLMPKQCPRNYKVVGGLGQNFLFCQTIESSSPVDRIQLYSYDKKHI